MSLQLIRYSEPLETDELAFLSKKEEKERKQFYKVIRVFMLFSFILPYIVAWFRAADGAQNPFSYFNYFIGVAFLLSFSGVATYIGYHRTLKQVQLDIRDRTKTIERTHITRKQYMPQNNTYYFYIDSPNRLSIDVSEQDYHRLDSGDELSIEYTTHSKLYLGYF
jgi:hypothetical protein